MRRRSVPLILPDIFFCYGGDKANLIILESPPSLGDLSADMVVVCLRLRMDGGFSLSGDGENIVDFCLSSVQSRAEIFGLSGLSFWVAFLAHYCRPTMMDGFLESCLFFLVSVSDKTSRPEVLEVPRAILSLFFFF